MVFAPGLGGGGAQFRLKVAQRLIPLWLSPVNRPARFRRGRKAGTRAPPPKPGGHVTLDSGTEGRASIRSHAGSLSSSFIPAGRLRTAPRSGAEKPASPIPSTAAPLSPRASLCRIGPCRQGFASPLRALDGSGPIRKTRCLRGERGGAGQGARRGGMAYQRRIEGVASA